MTRQIAHQRLFSPVEKIGNLYPDELVIFSTAGRRGKRFGVVAGIDSVRFTCSIRLHDQIVCIGEKDFPARQLEKVKNCQTGDELMKRYNEYREAIRTMQRAMDEIRKILLEAGESAEM